MVPAGATSASARSEQSLCVPAVSGFRRARSESPAGKRVKSGWGIGDVGMLSFSALTERRQRTGAVAAAVEAGEVVVARARPEPSQRVKIHQARASIGSSSWIRGTTAATIFRLHLPLICPSGGGGGGGKGGGCVTWFSGPYHGSTRGDLPHVLLTVADTTRCRRHGVLSGRRSARSSDCPK